MPDRTLYVCDLDGTLLRPDGTLGALTIQVVNRIVAAGGLFTYATARSYLRASAVTAGLDLALPVITYAGAVIVDPRSGRARTAARLPEAAVRTLQTTGSASLQPIMFAMHGGRDRVCWLEGRRTAGVDDFLAQRGGDPRLLPLSSWEEIDPGAVFFVSIIGEQAPARALRDQLGDLAGCHVAFGPDVYDPAAYWLEISAVNGTKAAALSTLRDELGAARVVCFGDSHNDLSMFAVADVAVAVANAADDVLAAATEIAAANADDGVARWLARELGLPTGPDPVSAP